MTSELDIVARETIANPFATEQVTAFEIEMAAYLGTNYVVAVSSGTAAIHCALDAMGVGPGDEVIVPAVAVVMSVAPILYRSATPVVADVADGRLDFNYQRLGELVTPKTKAIMPVYMWGCSYDVVRLRSFANDNGLCLIEDSCQAFGSKWRDRFLGTFGSAGCFSMRAGKILSCGEGGFVATNDQGIADQIKYLRNHGATPTRTVERFARTAYNYRLTELSAYVARTELFSAEGHLAKRRAQSAYIYGKLSSLDGLRLYRYDDDEIPNMYSPLLFATNLSQPGEVSKRLHDKGIHNSVGTFGLRPLLDWPMFRNHGRREREAQFPEARKLLSQLVAPVITRDMNDGYLDRICDSISSVLSEQRHE